ncbi:unnamed protein product [Diabrotica balteata]|uniref:Uncharacterized protein n=1 Tax=Diabrotica balteata TaxID=107213 RepID=A0A9N9SLQ5_DIABA|nr:unnamed protein product [Diabrotica balteata]
MLHNERWYFGIILDMKGYCGGSSSEENEPLTNTEIGSESDNTDNSEKNNKKSSDHLNNGDPYSDIDLSDTNDPTYTQCCEVPKCKGEVFSSCFRCQILLCWNHFMEDLPTCDKHRNQDSSDDSFVSKRRYRKKKKIDNRKPEDYNVEGASKEYEREVLTRTNKKRVAQVLRRSGAQYVSVDTKKTVSGRKLGSSCNSEWCKKGGRNCKKDNRGGRCANVVLKDEAKRKLIENHINRFPRVESHYCRKDSTREYLHSDLTLKRMYAMFIYESGFDEDKSSFTTYRAVFKAKNLSFHRPKKDLCSLCKTYHESSKEKKVEMQTTYDEHTKSKNAIREYKSLCKISAESDPEKTVCLCFDLQQVIHLPISNENAIFYKRRLAII